MQIRYKNYKFIPQITRVPSEKFFKKTWKLRKLVVFNSMLKNLQGLTLIDGLWQRINYTDIVEQLYTFASKVVTLFSSRLSMTYTVHEEIVVTIFVEEVLLVTN